MIELVLILFLLLFIYMFFNSFLNLMSSILCLLIFLFYLFNWINFSLFSSVSLNFGLDFFSFYMVVLTMWVFIILCYSSTNWFLDQFILLTLMIIFMTLGFMVIDFIIYYFFFECSMIPILLLLWGWGFYSGRYMAGMYMFMYTMVTSLPMFMILIYLSEFNLGIMYISFMGGLSISGLMYFFLVLMFLVKVPIFILHMWLPKAHVEAPIYGSMVLAAIMLKLGGYGLIRLFMLSSDLYLNDFLFSCCLLGSFFMSLMCLYYLDLKVIVAYSSVVHMSMMVCGFISNSWVGLLGGFFMMLSHAFSSSGMFYIVNILYERSGSRLMLFNKGVISVIPMYVFMMFMMIIGSIGVPPSFSILSEIFIMMGVMMYSYYLFVILFVNMFFCSFYLLKIILVLYDKFINSHLLLNEVKSSEYLVLILHILPINFIFLMLMSLH